MKQGSLCAYLMILLLFVEFTIALCVRDSFIRPYFGDFLATIFVYSLIRTFTKIAVVKSLIISVLFSYFVEVLQALNFLSLVNLRSNEVLATVAGTSFDWGDMLAYTLGGLSVFLFEYKINNLKFSQK